MKKYISIFIGLFIIISFLNFPDEKKYNGPFVKILSEKKFENNNFNSILFGSISIYKKKKLIKSIEKIQIRFKSGNTNRYNTITIMTNEYFLFQAVSGSLTIKDIFLGKKYYRINKRFSIGRGDLVYMGNIRLTLLKSSLSNYSYRTLVDTNFKALRFKYNRKLIDTINANSPAGFLKKTEGKILVPIYFPSNKGEYIDKYTPFNAVENGDMASLKLFLKNREIINETDSDGWSLLVTALRKKRRNIALFLIGNGIDVNIKTKSKWNALMFAVKYDSLDIAKILIKKGADPKAELDDGWNTLFLALRYGCDNEFLKMLLDRGVNISKAKKDRWTPLMMSLVYSNEDISNFLFDKGAEIRVKDDENWTPLMYALRYGKNKLAKKIIEKNADINAENKNGWTPLLFALRYKSKECASLIFNKGADFTKANRNGFTPLHMALEYNFPEIAREIIKSGKTISDKTRYGWTPLMYALRNGQSSAASMLLAKKASLDGVSKSGWNVLHFALRYDQTDNALKILRYGKIDINEVTSNGWTPLLMAIRYNQPNAARLLIRKGADLNKPNKFGWTPLMMSIEYDLPVIAKILIKKGVKKKLKNSDGKSAFDLARDKNYFNLFKLMGGGNFSVVAKPKKREMNVRDQSGLKGIWEKIIPLKIGSRILKSENCTENSSICSAEIEYPFSKAETFKFLINEIKAKGFIYDKGVNARTETGSLGNKNIWGLVNFTKNSPTHIVSFTIIILSDYKSGKTKTVVSFVRTRIAKKMNMSFPKAMIGK